MLQRAGIGARVPVRESMIYFFLDNASAILLSFLICELLETRNCGRLHKILAVVSNA